MSIVKILKALLGFLVRLCKGLAIVFCLLFLIFWIIIPFFTAKTAQIKTTNLYKSFKIGQPISNFSLPKAKIISISFQGKHTKKQCGSLVVLGNNRCQFTNRGENKEYKIYEQEIKQTEPKNIPQFIAKNPGFFSGCNEMNISLYFGMLIGTFSVFYDGQEGIITATEEPYYWD